MNLWGCSFGFNGTGLEGVSSISMLLSVDFQAFRRLGVRKLKPEELNEVVQALDLDGSGDLDLVEPLRTGFDCSN